MGGVAESGNFALADETQIALSYNDVNASHLLIQIFRHQFVLLWRNILFFEVRSNKDFSK